MSELACSRLMVSPLIRPVGDNNISGRVNNTIRTRERNYRGLKTDETPMLPLFVAYYNLIREHQALGMTPAAAAGIISDKNSDRWLNLIKQAARAMAKKNQASDSGSSRSTL
ncbi:MAG: hypothetical protein ACREBU_15035 [Nitrososphaera sp.]